MAKKTFSILQREDYDKQISFRKNDINCYSEKKLKSLYGSEDGYTVVGDVVKSNPKKFLSEIVIESSDGYTELKVTEAKKNHGLFYGKCGYVAVGKDEYVALYKFRLLFIIIFLILLVGLIVAGLALLIPNGEGDIDDPINPLPMPDTYVEPVDDPGDYGDVDAEQRSVSLEYTLKATLDLATNEIRMNFTNPKRSNRDIILEMFVISGEDTYCIAKSGRIAPGYALHKMIFNGEVQLTAGERYSGKYKASYFNPKTGEKELVDTDIVDLIITVK